MAQQGNVPQDERSQESHVRRSYAIDTSRNEHMSVFQQQLPRKAVNIRLRLPVICKGSATSIWGTYKRDSASHRTYDVLVLPDGRPRKVKEIFRESVTAPKTSEPVAEDRSCTGVPHSMVDTRLAFRSERARRFHSEKQFPVLVGTEELVPVWHEQVDHATEVAESATKQVSITPSTARGGRKTKKRMDELARLDSLARPTHSATHRKQEKKLEEDPLHPWALTNNTEAKKSISDRIPCLHEDEYDAMEEVRKKGLEVERSRVISSKPLRPGGSTQEDLEKEQRWQEVQERSKDARDWLKHRYHMEREQYKKAAFRAALERDAEWSRRAAKAAAQEEEKAKAKNAQAHVEKAPEEEAHHSLNIGGLFRERGPRQTLFQHHHPGPLDLGSLSTRASHTPHQASRYASQESSLHSPQHADVGRQKSKNF